MSEIRNDQTPDLSIAGVSLGTVEAAPPDPFEPALYRLAAERQLASVKKRPMTIPVGRPPNSVFFRVHPAAEYRVAVGLVVLDQGEKYLVRSSLQAQLAEEPVFRCSTLYSYVTRSGSLGLWDIKLPGPDGTLDSWNSSAAEIARQAMTTWARVVSNREAGGYDFLVPEMLLPDPEWPSLSLAEILSIAFRGKLIDTPDHAVLRQLRGASL
jgi:hypothetical protein